MVNRYLWTCEKHSMLRANQNPGKSWQARYIVLMLPALGRFGFFPGIGFSRQVNPYVFSAKSRVTWAGFHLRDRDREVQEPKIAIVIRE
jgi:hypothetical protein